MIFLPNFKAKFVNLPDILPFLFANFTAAIKRAQLSEKAFLRGCDVIHSTMSSYKGESETSESEHSHGSKASCDEETYGDSHSSENSDEKKKSNLELLIFVDNIINVVIDINT